MGVLARYGDEAKILAGGQSLVPMLAYRLAAPRLVVDITRVPDLAGFELDGGLVVRAGATQRALERSLDVGLAFPVLHEAIAHIAHPQIRNRGTLCGSVAHADPAAELPATMVALDATMVVVGPAGTRRIPAEDFFRFHLTTALEPDELLAAVSIPRLGPATSASFLEVAHRRGDFALVGAVVVVSFAEGAGVADCRIVCAGVGPVPFRAARAEEVLRGRALDDEALLEAQWATPAGMEALDDPHATAAYRRHVAGVLVRRALDRIRAEQGASRG